MADTHVNAYRDEHEAAKRDLVQAQGRVVSTGEALDTKLAETGEPAEYAAPKKGKKPAEKPSEPAPETAKPLNKQNKAELLASAEAADVEVNEDATNKEIVAAIKKGSK